MNPQIPGLSGIPSTPIGSSIYGAVHACPSNFSFVEPPIFQSSYFRPSSIKLHMCIYSKATTVVGASSIHNSPVALHIQRMDSLMNYFYM